MRGCQATVPQEPPPTELQRKILPWLIWVALVSSVAIYLVVIKVIAGEPDPSATRSTGLRSVLLVVAPALLVISFALRWLVTARAKDWNVAFGAYVASLALAECCAIFALVLGFQGFGLSQIYIFFALSFGGLLAQPPTVLPK